MKLTIKAIRVPDVYDIQKRMLASIEKEWGKWVAKHPEKELESTVANWDNRPEFYHKVDVRPGKWYYGQYHRAKTTAGEIYNWVRNGTGLYGPRHAAYTITPVGANILAFSTPHAPKTLAPGQSMPSGPRSRVFTNRVTHPGIEPRNDARGFPGWVVDHYVKSTRGPNTMLPVLYDAGRDALRRR